MRLAKQSLAYLVLMLITFVSIKYEFMGYSHILSKLESVQYDGLWASIVAVVCNLGKFLVIQSMIESKSKAFRYNWGAYVTVFLLMINSFIWSLSVMGSSLDSPQLKKVAAEHKQHIKESFENKELALIKKHKQSKQLFEKQTKQVQANLEAQFQPEIDLYEQQLVKERENKNAFSGFYQGEKYKDIEKRLYNVKLKKTLAFSNLQERLEKKSVMFTNKMDAEFQAISDKYTQEFDDLNLSRLKLSGDERIQDPLLTSLLNIFNEVTNSHLSYVQLIALISTLMALIVEFLAFSLLHIINNLRKEKVEEVSLLSSRKNVSSLVSVSNVA